MVCDAHAVALSALLALVAFSLADLMRSPGDETPARSSYRAEADDRNSDLYASGRARSRTASDVEEKVPYALAADWRVRRLASGMGCAHACERTMRCSSPCQAIKSTWAGRN